MKEYNIYVYILTNWNNDVMYIGMTNNLERRLYEHKNKLVDGFTKKYNINKLVYYEHTTDIHAAIAREKEIKKSRREKKNNLRRARSFVPSTEDDAIMSDVASVPAESTAVTAVPVPGASIASPAGISSKKSKS